MYTMGTLLRHGGAEQKSAGCRHANGELRLQAFGVTEPTSGTDTLGCAPRCAGGSSDL